FSTASIRGSASTQTTRAAPRLTASRPTAPVPAKRSRNAHPGTRAASTLKSAPRTRSVVGRACRPAGGASRRPFSVPAMMRMGPSVHQEGPVLDLHGLPEQPVVLRRKLRVARQELLGVGARRLQQRQIAAQLGDLEIREPRLPGAEDL